MERSQVPLSAVLKTSWKMMTRPDFTKSMVTLQAEKQFFNQLYPQHNLGRANKIRQLSFRITDLCNLRCHTCGQWGDNGYLLNEDINDLRKQEVPAERYIQQLHDLKKNGHQPILYFWGGEPMLYKGLLDVIDAGAKLGMPPTIATNGTNVGKNAERMCAAPMALIQISVDGSNPETHNAARPGQKKSHDNFKDVIFACEELKRIKKDRKQQLPLVVTLTTINRENYFDLVNIYERFRGLADMHIFYLSWWIDDATAKAQVQDYSDRFGEQAGMSDGWVGDWNKFDYNVLSQQLKKLKQLSWPATSSPVYIMPDLVEPEDLVTYYTKHSERFGFDQCVSIFQNPEIDSNGNMSPCRDYHDYVVGNMKESSILELWNNERYVKFRQSISKEGLMPMCSRCCGLMGY